MLIASAFKEYFSTSLTFTTVHPVTHIIHMLIASILGMEYRITIVALKTLRPVLSLVHMPVSRVFRNDYSGTRLALEAFRPMVCSVHMLIAIALVTENMTTSRTFYPVVFVVQMIFEFI